MSAGFRLSVEVRLCLLKMVCWTVFLMTILVYDTVDVKELTTNSYWILVQVRMLVLLPMFIALIHESRFRRDHRLHHFIKRKIAEGFHLPPRQIQPNL